MKRGLIENVLNTIGLGNGSIGIAFGGGGARGFSHVGVVKALEHFGIKPSIISGVSAGAIAAALYGAGLSSDDMLECFNDYSHFTDFTEWSLPKSGFMKLNKFEKILASWLPHENLEEQIIPTIICATDLDNAKSVGFTKGEITPRVAASCSIPVIFSPVKIKGVNYVDGGVLRNLPAWAIREYCHTLIGCNCSPIDRKKAVKESIISIAFRSYQLMTKSNARQDLDLCDIIVQCEALSRVGTFKVSEMKKIVSKGYDEACKVFEKNFS